MLPQVQQWNWEDMLVQGSTHRPSILWGITCSEQRHMLTEAYLHGGEAATVHVALEVFPLRLRSKQGRSAAQLGVKGWANV